MDNHRRRRHRLKILNDVEKEIEILRAAASSEEDISLWKQGEGKYMNVFSAKKTWLQLRSAQAACGWSKGIWFSQSTPKYSFIILVALRQRLNTCDRIQRWNAAINPTCVLCNATNETCHHFLFSCDYSKQIWQALAGGILQGDFTTSWDGIVDIISKTDCLQRSSF